jgi:hypothetical protein
VMEPLVIDGWTCRVIGALRYARNADGLGAALNEAGASFDTVLVPPAVLAWLIRPLLHEAWEVGALTALRQALRQGPLPDLCNPHVDSGGTDGTG